jgi:hypothetical protein
MPACSRSVSSLRRRGKGRPARLTDRDEVDEDDFACMTRVGENAAQKIRKPPN